MNAVKTADNYSDFDLFSHTRDDVCFLISS